MLIDSFNTVLEQVYEIEIETEIAKYALGQPLPLQQ